MGEANGKRRCGRLNPGTAAELRTAYAGIWKDFHPDPNGSLDRQRLIHLLKHMGFGHLRMDLDRSLARALREKDWEAVYRIILQNLRFQAIPLSYGGNTFEKNIYLALAALAIGDFDDVDRLLLPQMCEVKLGRDPFFPPAAPLLYALVHRDLAMQEKVLPLARRFLSQKRGTLYEKRIVQCMVQLRDYNVEKAGIALQEVCQYYTPSVAPFNCGKAFCVIANGLYILASAILPAQDFVQLEVPKQPIFQEEFALWILGRADQGTQPGVWVEYPEEVPWVSRILEQPCAKTALEQPFLNDPRPYSNTRNQWMANGPRSLEEFADELWEAGIGHEWKYHE